MHFRTITANQTRHRKTTSRERTMKCTGVAGRAIPDGQFFGRNRVIFRRSAKRDAVWKFDPRCEC